MVNYQWWAHGKLCTTRMGANLFVKAVCSITVLSVLCSKYRLDANKVENIPNSTRFSYIWGFDVKYLLIKTQSPEDMLNAYEYTMKKIFNQDIL